MKRKLTMIQLFLIFQMFNSLSNCLMKRQGQSVHRVTDLELPRSSAAFGNDPEYLYIYLLTAK